MDPRALKAKCMRIIQEHDDVLNYIINTEIGALGKISLLEVDEFNTLKKVFLTEGKKEGLRTFIQKINEYAAKDI